MYNQYFAGTFDLTALVLGAFFAFFGALVLYLLREGRREGFPLEHDVTGRLESVPDVLLSAEPKTFLFADGTSAQAPNGVRDTHVTNLRRTAGWSGSPFKPAGEPIGSGVGPGGYAMRADRPDMTTHGEARIAPLRVAEAYYIDPKDRELRGMDFLGLDDAKAGTIADIWVDRSEFIVRYLEVALADGGGRTVLVPMTMCTLDRVARNVKTDSLLASQMSAAPALANPNQVTLLEEEKIVGYFGGGYLYATAARSEPVL